MLATMGVRVLQCPPLWCQRARMLVVVLLGVRSCATGWEVTGNIRCTWGVDYWP